MSTTVKVRRSKTQTIYRIEHDENLYVQCNTTCKVELVDKENVLNFHSLTI